MATVIVVVLLTLSVQGVDVKVDTFNEESVYAIGQPMAVSCNPTRGCIEDAFFAKWGDCIIDFFLSLTFFSPLLAWKCGLWPTNGKLTALHLQRGAQQLVEPERK